MANQKRVVNILTALLLISGCTGGTFLAPVDTLEQPPSYKIQSHVVARDETLYSIAWRYTMDTNVLANMNGIKSPYIVYPGQRLQLIGSKVVTNRSQKPISDSETHVGRSRFEPNSPPSKVSPEREAANLRWQWPARGPILSRFGGSRSLKKGVDIGVEKGQPVLAAESGIIVYAGSGLRGYGNLLIVRHNKNFLSAYAHNDKLIVGEGQAVKAGQQIAETGSSGTDRNKLHFEIRLNGDPVDPLRYLPRG